MPNLLAALWALVFFALLLAFSKLVRPARRGDANRYSSGSSSDSPMGFDDRSDQQSEGQPWIRMPARYQLLFVAATMFFLGVLLLYPAVATFRQWIDEGHGAAALIAIGVFLATLAVALAYAWMKGDLSWIKDKEDNGTTRERLS